jgi:hypothetical protein
MKRLKLKSIWDTSLQLPHHCILRIKPDDKWSNITHIKTNFQDHKKKLIWFHVKHNYAEILDMYYQIKNDIGRR